MQGRTYHVEGNDIFEGDSAGLVFLDENFVDLDGGGAGRKTEDKGVRWSWCEGFDSVFKMLDLKTGAEL